MFSKKILICILISFSIQQSNKQIRSKKKTSAKCDLKPKKFYDSHYQTISILKLYQLLSKEQSSETDEFGEGIFRSINENFTLLSEQISDIYNFVRRRFGELLPLENANLTKWEKIQKELNKQKSNYSSFIIRNKISEPNLVNFLQNLKVEGKNYVKIFDDKKKDTDEQFYKEDKLENIVKVNQNIKENVKKYRLLTNKYNTNLQKFNFKSQLEEINKIKNELQNNINTKLKNYASSIKGIDLLNGRKNDFERIFLDGAKQILNLISSIPHLNNISNHPTEIISKSLEIKDIIMNIYHQNKNMIDSLKNKTKEILENHYQQEYNQFIKNGFKIKTK